MGLSVDGMKKESPNTLLITAFFPPMLGGLEHFWYSVARRWQGGRLTVFTTPLRQGEKDVSDVSVIRREFFPWKRCKPSWLPLLWQISKIIRERRAQRLLFGHYANYAILGPVLRLFLGVRYDLMSHGIDSVLPQQSWLNRKLFQFVLRYADKLYANSNHTAKHFQVLKNFEKKVVVAHPGISFQDYIVRKQAETNAVYQILSVGRLVKVKGIDTAIKALGQLKDRLAFHYTIVGDGPEKKHLEELVISLGLEKNVSFVGTVANKPELKSEWYNQADLFLLPSKPVNGHYESFGMVLLEAACFSLPAIATTQSGAEDIIIDQVTGLLVPPDDASALSSAIYMLSKDEAKARKMGEAHHARVAQNFQWQDTMEALQHA